MTAAALLLSGSLLGVAGPALCAGKKLVAVVVFAAGDVRVKRAAGGEVRPARAADELSLGDSLETGADGRASVALIYGAELRVNSLSVLEFSAGPKGGFVRLARGQVWTRLLHRGAGLQLRTPSAICAVRGTEADIEQRGQLTVKVYEGHVDVDNGGGRVALKAGELTRVAGAAYAPEPASDLSPGQWTNWQGGVTAANVSEVARRLAMAAGNEEKALEFSLHRKGLPDLKIKAKLKKRAPRS